MSNAMSIFKAGSNNFLQRSLDASEIRNNLIANNIANEKTPNYMAMDLDFKGYVAKARDEFNMNLTMDKTSPMHLDAIGTMSGLPADMNPMLISYDNTTQEDQMKKLAINSTTYKTSAELLNRSYANLKAVIVP